MLARNTNVPFKGRIQKRKTYHLQIITFRLQRAAGPYRNRPARAKEGPPHFFPDLPPFSEPGPFPASLIQFFGAQKIGRAGPRNLDLGLVTSVSEVVPLGRGQ